MGIFLLILILIGFWLLFFKKREWLGFYVLIILIFMPKFSVFKLHNYQGTNLTVDDFIILFYIVISFIELFRFNKEVFKNKIFVLYAVFVVLSFISFAIGMICKLTLFKMFSFLSVIRKIEYFCYLFVGVDIAIYCKRKNLDFVQIFSKIMKAFIVYSFVLCIFQKLGAIGCFRQGVYDTVSARERCFGSFNGPYELAQFMTFIFIFDLLNVLKRKPSKKELAIDLTFIFLAFFVILLTKSRIMLLVSLAVAFIMILVYGSKALKIAVGVTLPTLVILLLVGSMFISIPGFGRLSSLQPKEIYNSIVYSFKNMNYENYKLTILEGEPEFDFLYGGGDLSLNIRLFKWASVISLFLKHPLFGVGFGSNSVLDGNIVKLLVENGVLGLIAFFTVLIYCTKLRKNSEFAEALPFIVISLILGSLLIDIFDSSKCMEFFWLIVGICMFKIESNADEKRLLTQNKNTNKKLINKEENL